MTLNEQLEQLRRLLLVKDHEREDIQRQITGIERRMEDDKLQQYKLSVATAFDARQDKTATYCLLAQKDSINPVVWSYKNECFMHVPVGSYRVYDLVVSTNTVHIARDATDYVIMFTGVESVHAPDETNETKVCARHPRLLLDLRSMIGSRIYTARQQHTPITKMVPTPRTDSLLRAECNQMTHQIFYQFQVIEQC